MSKVDVRVENSKCYRECSFTSSLKEDTDTVVSVMMDNQPSNDDDDDYCPVNGKDACRKVKRKIRKTRKKQKKDLNCVIGLINKLDVERKVSRPVQENPISVLNEVCLKNHWTLPTYSLCQGRPSKVKCMFLDRVVIGSGKDKIAAKQDAARNVLNILET